MLLTKKEAKAWIPILQAFVEGKPIKMRSPYVSNEVVDWVDIDTSKVLPISFTNHIPIDPEAYYKVD